MQHLPQPVQLVLGLNKALELASAKEACMSNLCSAHHVEPHAQGKIKTTQSLMNRQVVVNSVGIFHDSIQFI